MHIVQPSLLRGLALSPQEGSLPAVRRLYNGYVHLGLYGFVHVVGEGIEGDVGDHLHDLLVGVPGLPDLVERLVRGVAPTLEDLPPKVEGGGPLRILGLEVLRLLALVLAEALLLGQTGVDRQAVSTAIEVRHSDGDGLLELTVEGSTLKSFAEVHVPFKRRGGDGHLLEVVD